MAQPTSRGIALGSVLGFSLAALAACAPATGDPHEDDPGTLQAVDQRVSLLNDAYCTIKVSGVGNRDTETDYLPHVIACENGGADLQALKAQAIAARSVAYYNMASQGSICDGQGCQVYSCNAKPSALHYQAVKETAQQYLSYGNMLTYGFYVAGDSQVVGPTCVDVGGSTTHYVTFNDGKSGTGVKQTKLGWVGPPGFGQNRGCMSQWGGRCLEQQGRDYLGILRFYYGSDIAITNAPGNCGVGTPPEPPPPAAAACGDGSCDSGSGEDCNTCPGDCGACPAPPSQPQPGASSECAGHCGQQAPSGCWCDASCAQFGDCCGDGSSCSACGNCGGSGSPPPAAQCGDGTCNGSETCGDCPGDCGSCPSGGGSGGSCSVASHQGNGENGESCTDPAESWRCVFLPSWGTWGSQVCRYGVWNTYHLNPKSCSACCGSYVSGCSAK
ncbi:MAG: hypothetical protein HS104_20785 [Polyangiaceae bacterium]|nr:hypothetical protein [Polyangiaceae bacterium]MCL4749641.1 hypothetical protein [Myxococcales bacterium]